LDALGDQIEIQPLTPSQNSTRKLEPGINQMSARDRFRRLKGGENCDDCDALGSIRAAATAAASKEVPKQAPKAEKGESSSQPSQPAPPDTAELGRATWTLLHTTAAFWPKDQKDVSKERATAAERFVESLPLIFPCGYCADDFAGVLEEIPFGAPFGTRNNRSGTIQDCENGAATSRECFADWACRAHNRVNAKLGKPLFDCGADTLDARWRRQKKQE
jgi:mitochondrial FAD-linked sulfhydryl oxidase